MNKDNEYADYLIENHDDELHTKDQLTVAQEDGYMIEEFARYFLMNVAYEGRVTTIITQNMIDKFLEDLE